MDINSIATIAATILGSIGGLEFFRWLGGRKKDNVVWLEERITQRDLKIDALYVELRKEQADKLNWIHKYHELELLYKEAEWNRCNVRHCEGRIPPRGEMNKTINDIEDEKK